MIKVFIDSNVYLALYSSVTNQVSLEMIRHLSESGNLIVTKQNVDEVIRNRYKLASELLSEKTVMPESKYPGMLRKNLLLSGQTVTEEIVTQFIANYSPVRNKILDHLKQAIDSVAVGQDPISIELSRIFHNPINHDQAIYSKAIERRKVGNPPGKKRSCIGDELNWEIVKSICRDGNEVFIISKDSDFWIKKNGRVFLHPLLQHECEKEDITVNVFNDLILAYREYNSRATEALVIPADLPQQGDELSVPVATTCTHPSIIIQEIGTYTCHVCMNCGRILQRMLTFCYDD